MQRIAPHARRDRTGHGSGVLVPDGGGDPPVVVARNRIWSCWSSAPIAALAVLPVMRPLERRQTVERERRSEASSIAADTVVGLRVLRGLGGEEEFAEPVLRGVATGVRRATVRTALAQSILDSFQVLFPGAILVAVTYLGARLVVEGTISPGHLVAYYAYAAFLLLPIQTLMEAATRWSAATVAAGRVISVLCGSDPDLVRPSRRTPRASSPRRGPLADSSTGLRHRAGPADGGGVA